MQASVRMTSVERCPQFGQVIVDSDRIARDYVAEQVPVKALARRSRRKGQSPLRLHRAPAMLSLALLGTSGGLDAL